jgi:signal transduction histidine kinase
VQDIVTAHGWEIDITTGPDGGARFEITGVTISR